ncbi:hypothetical protein PybrP1_004147 [[Pythium] brassicae (nom. inval.)]|nr:hypothetical protein PybrP1_004147 [[Pythium] brassicae (nom. inval.)]
MRTLALLLLLVLAGAAALAAGDDSQRLKSVLDAHMSTKTKYPPPPPSGPDAWVDSARCRPVQLNWVVRHGTRFPTIKDIDRIDRTIERLRAGPGGAASWVQRWASPYRADAAGWLAPVGVAELAAMGERVRARFGAPLDVALDPARFAFEATWKPRTQQSAAAFAFGFFGGRYAPLRVHVDAVGVDHALRFFANCPAYDRAIDQNASATIHHAQYRGGAQMRRNLRAFRERAGDAALTQTDLEAAYAGCAFDVAVRGVYDEWCALFDAETLHAMDYFHDLKHFYKKSHGHALAFAIAAPLLQDVFRSLRARAARASGAVAGHFRFAHAETILPLASLLDLSYFDRHANDRDGHFLADTPLAVAKTRKFRGSALAPFAANIGFVLYECDDDDGAGAADAIANGTSFHVATLLNERPVRFRECGDRVLCPFPDLQRIFRRWIHEFDFHEQCA